MVFEPVWVSSIAHLRTFEDAYRTASLPQKCFGAFTLPDGFSHMRAWTGVPWRLPVIMFASGTLQVDGAEIWFVAKRKELPLIIYWNMRDDLHFELTANQIVGIEQFPFVSPAAQYYTMPFTRIRTTLSGELSDFLVCVGAYNPFMGSIRKKNSNLLNVLTQTFPHAI